MAKRRNRANNLKDIHINEVSFVDNPANQREFLLFKRNSKGKTMDKELLKALKAYLGLDDQKDVDFKKEVTEEEIQKALTLITENYKEDFPADLEKAVGVIATQAAYGFEIAKSAEEEVKKAGAKFSADARKKITAVIAALQALLPGDKDTKKSNSDDDDKSDLSKQLEELKTILEKSDSNDDSKEKDSAIEELTKSVKEMAERLQTLEKGGAVRKSVEGQDEDDDDDNVQKGAGENGEVLWPSFTKAAKG